METLENETPPTKPQITLTEEQQQAVDLISTWFLSSPEQEFKLGGYAGTGKTTIIKVIRERLNARSLVMAFTGKACNVLRRKDIHASTIHSNIYDCYQDKEGWHFDLKTILPAMPKLLIIDEASMLSSDLYRDLKSFGAKLLFVGDPGQLEPVGDNPNLMANPDYVLSKIHRQAEASPIITLASSVRLGVGGALTHHCIGTEVSIKQKTTTPEEILSASQLICAKNATRQGFNTLVRGYLNRPAKQLVPEDKIIVLRNNLSFSVFNGMILFVASITNETADYWRITAHPYSNLDVWKKPFQTVMKKDEHIPRKFVYCDFAYAITCHKSQGSEWDNVIVYDEWMPPQVWDMKRWRYTAITRAAKQLTYLV